MEIYRESQRGKTRQGESPGKKTGKKPAHAGKLKNASSAKRAAGEKFRYGKKDNGLSPEEKRLLAKKKAQHARSVRAEAGISRGAHRDVDQANEDQNSGTEALNHGVEVAENAVRLAEDRVYSMGVNHAGKSAASADVTADAVSEFSDADVGAGTGATGGIGGAGSGYHTGTGNGGGRNAADFWSSGGASVSGSSVQGMAGTSGAYGGANGFGGAVSAGYGNGSSAGIYSSKLGSTAREARANAAQAGSNTAAGSKAAQKNLMKKELQRSMRQKADREAANSIGNIARKFVDRAQDIGGKIGEWVWEHASQHPLAIVIALVIALILMAAAGGASSVNVLMQTMGGGTIASSYTAEDHDIVTVDHRYKELEAEIAEKVSRIESEYPGYDEYQYDLAEIGHNPFELAALLTVLYEDYTPEEAEEIIHDLLESQYELTTTPVTEIRTRTVERTGTRTVTDDDENEVEEEYTYEDEEEYEYRILKVKLENKSMVAVVQNAGLTDDQISRYEILHETYGNKKYLFEDDIYANPDADGGAVPGRDQGEQYRPAGEALTDAQFAAMWEEAQKHLGRAYVWGGSSPSTGFDCSGFVCWVINQSGAGSIGRTTAEGVRQWTNKISKSDRQPGDIIFFQGTYNTPGASHVGIYIGDGKMVHCGDPIKVSKVDSGYFANHLLSYGRIP